VGQVFDLCDNHEFQANETTESKNCWVWVFAKTSKLPVPGNSKTSKNHRVS
jgi:hypothetical protein